MADPTDPKHPTGETAEKPSAAPEPSTPEARDPDQSEADRERPEVPETEAALFEARSDIPADNEEGNASAESDGGASDAAVAKPARGGRLIAFLALLLSAAALAASGYLYYQLQQSDPLAPVISRMDSVEAESRRLQSMLSELRSEQADDLAAAVRNQRQALEEQRSALLQSLSSAASQGPPSSREWRIAEVGYLLRIANHRLLMERDVPGALELLLAADEILIELDDFAFYQVRSRLAEETRALQALETQDLPGIYLELEAMKRTLRQLPLKLPRYLDQRLSAAPTDSDAEPGFWAGLRQELSSKFRLRSFDADIKPLLAPEEAVYLELNLRLMLERAQLAALRRQQLVFSESLETAAAWLEEYLDQSDSEVMTTAAELRRLAAIQLDIDLPDISGSLSALQALRRAS